MRIRDLKPEEIEKLIEDSNDKNAVYKLALGYSMDLDTDDLDDIKFVSDKDVYCKIAEYNGTKYFVSDIEAIRQCTPSVFSNAIDDAMVDEMDKIGTEISKKYPKSVIFNIHNNDAIGYDTAHKIYSREIADRIKEVVENNKDDIFKYDDEEYFAVALMDIDVNDFGTMEDYYKRAN